MALIMACTSVSFAGTFVAFGPENFVRATGKPLPVTTHFTILNPNTAFTLRLDNGGLHGTLGRVSSAVITLNGVEVARPSDFNQKVARIEKPVKLALRNDLVVELRGQPGGGITVQVIGVDNDLPAITATVEPPPNAAGWHNADVTVRFACSDSTSGIATCTAPVTVATEGANQLIDGTAVDRAGNTATASATVNLDKTAPLVDITSPADGATLRVAALTVTGTVSDALSGVAGVTCNGSTAAVVGATFSCDVALVDRE